jgi:2-polyprenyl-3-methyl-5-hydroxy-6-metoxy-1,4-benzoquinol methylase
MSLWPLGIPTWQMPEWMQHAILEWRSKKAQQVQGILQTQNDDRQVKIRERIRVAPSKSTKTLLEECWFNEKDWVYLDFQWRTVLDIGWGFGWVAPRLHKSKCEQITLVDPIFSENNIQIHYDRDIELANKRLNSSHEPSTHPSAEIARMRKANAIESQKIFDELNWWKTYDPDGEHHRIKRNPSFWENIEWVPGDSQDYVFVKNVLFKETVKPKEFIKEIHRVLRNGGCLILSDIFSDDEKGKQKDTEVLEILRWVLPYNDSNYTENEKWRITLKIFKH